MAEERCAPIFFAPFVSSPMRVEAAWIDDHGLLPAAYHHVLFDRALKEALGVIGLDGEPAGNGAAFPLPCEVHTRHTRAVRAGDQVRITLQLLDHDGEHLHVYLEMRHAAEGWTAASCEVLAIHADVSTRRAEPFPAHIQRNLAVMKAAHARLGRPASPSGLTVPQPRAEPGGLPLAARTRH